ncbi:hypothetical protein ABZU32_15605 [Sphaerisporangium sp. NPDC005288]|uniref:hypothetical protein n=1 Tax=Sphaerisporangium sp. NPDC005288 TaxID=3155114 RepID=UPI0033B3E92A
MRPSSVLPLAVLIGGPLLLCAAAHATGARHGRVLTDVVQYHCASGPPGAQPQDVRVRDAPGADRSGKVTRIPAGAADTGGGGLAGPDGRVLVGVGLLVVLAAGAGLRSRRDSNNG